jgi:hypothetical protein
VIYNAHPIWTRDDFETYALEWRTPSDIPFEEIWLAAIGSTAIPALTTIERMPSPVRSARSARAGCPGISESGALELGVELKFTA